MINNEITSWTQPVGSEIKGEVIQGRVYKSLIYLILASFISTIFR
jgi:hypothetical protein